MIRPNVIFDADSEFLVSLQNFPASGKTAKNHVFQWVTQNISGPTQNIAKLSIFQFEAGEILYQYLGGKKHVPNF